MINHHHHICTIMVLFVLFLRSSSWHFSVKQIVHFETVLLLSNIFNHQAYFTSSPIQRCIHWSQLQSLQWSKIFWFDLASKWDKLKVASFSREDQTCSGTSIRSNKSKFQYAYKWWSIRCINIRLFRPTVDGKI